MSIIEEFSNDAALRMEGPTIASLVYYSHGCAKEKGWHDPKFTEEEREGILGAIFTDSMNIATGPDFLERVEAALSSELKTPGDDIALMHSELSEALEEFRSGRPLNEVYYSYPDGTVSANPSEVAEHSGDYWKGKPEGVPIELADELIRIFDFCGKHDIDIESALLTKMEYNFTRGYRHGGKAI